MRVKVYVVNADTRCGVVDGIFFEYDNAYTCCENLNATGEHKWQIRAYLMGDKPNKQTIKNLTRGTK